MTMFSIEIVAFLVGASIVFGALDLLRQPGWAWKRAEESKIAYLVLVVLLPIVGVGMYVFTARPRVVDVTSAGRAAGLVFERYGDDAALTQREECLITAPVALRYSGEFTGGPPGPGPTMLDKQTAEVGAAGTFSAGSRTAGPGAGAGQERIRTYRPIQRTSAPVVASTAPLPTVPAGWKADPTGRHQFRYWGGLHWTENVADAGVQAKDPIGP